MGPGPDGPLGVRGDGSGGAAAGAFLGADPLVLGGGAADRPVFDRLRPLADLDGGRGAPEAGRPGLRRRSLALVSLLLWLWCGFCWLWNAAYYASSFQEKSGLRVQPYPVETLIQVTALFAQRAAECSTQVERDENGRFDVSRDEILGPWAGGL